MPNAPDAVLLCGGAGLRLRSVIGNAPKGIADVAGRPFLELLLWQLRRHGVERAILADGYEKELLRSHLGGRAFGLQLAYSVESCPLGTGGALRNAADLIESDDVLIMDGNSYNAADLCEFVVVHHETNADLCVLVVSAGGRGDCGSVLIDASGRLAGFAEKQDSFHTPYVVAGIYMMSRQMLYEIPPGLEVSLEGELLSQWLRQGRNIVGFVCSGRSIDIGTPERYRSAPDMLANVEVDASAHQRESQL